MRKFLAIAHVDPSLTVDEDTVGLMELARLVPGLAPGT